MPDHSLLQLIPIHLAATLLADVIRAGFAGAGELVRHRNSIEKLRRLIEKCITRLPEKLSGFEIDGSALNSSVLERIMVDAVRVVSTGQSKSVVEALMNSNDFYFADDIVAKSAASERIANGFTELFYEFVSADQQLSDYLELKAYTLMLHQTSNLTTSVDAVLSKLDEITARITANSSHLTLVNSSFMADQMNRANAQYFYWGNTTWGDIISGYDFRRSVRRNGVNNSYDQLLSSVKESVDSPGVGLWLITAPAGEGKTALMYRLGIDLYSSINPQSPREYCVLYTNESYVDYYELEALYAKFDCPLVLLLDGHNLPKMIRNLDDVIPKAASFNYRIKILLTARTNEWEVSGGALGFANKLTSNQVVEIPQMNEAEISSLLILLERHDALGEIAKFPSQSERISYVKQFTGKWLLVALMEASHGGQTFESIILNEFRNLPEEAQRLYSHVSLLYALRLNPLVHVLRNLYRDLDNMSLPTGVLFRRRQRSEPDTIRGRHPLIAEVVFRSAFNSHERLMRFEELIDAIPKHALWGRVYLFDILSALQMQTRIDSSDLESVCGSILEYLIGEERRWRDFQLVTRELFLRLYQNGRISEVLRWSRLLYLAGNYTDCKYVLQRTLNFVNDVPQLHFFLAKCLLKMSTEDRQVAVALRHLEKALQLGIDYVDFFVFYSSTLHRIGEMKKGLQVACDGLSRYPEEERLIQQLNMTFGSSLRNGELPQFAETIMSSGPIDHRARLVNYLLIVTLRLLGRHDEAYDLSHHLMATGPVSCREQALHASCLADAKEDYDGAIELLLQVIQRYTVRDLNAAKWRNNIAIWIHKLRLCEAKDSESLWNESVSIAPRYPWPYIELARHLLECKNDKSGSLKALNMGRSIAIGAKNTKAVVAADLLLTRVQL